METELSFTLLTLSNAMKLKGRKKPKTSTFDLSSLNQYAKEISLFLDTTFDAKIIRKAITSVTSYAAKRVISTN